jgi:LPXTG-motif cell wall-anchored protein
MVMKSKKKILVSSVVAGVMMIPLSTGAQSAVGSGFSFASISKDDGSILDVTGKSSITTNDPTPRICVESDFINTTASVIASFGGSNVINSMVSTGPSGDFCFTPEGALSAGQYSFAVTVTKDGQTYSDILDVSIVSELPTTGTGLDLGLILLISGVAVTSAGFILKRKRN